MAAGMVAAGGGPGLAAMVADMNAHLEAELTVEEGREVFIYDDAKGAVRFKKGDTLVGNLTTGTGINLMVDFDQPELDFIETNRINKARALLKPYAWYSAQDEVRQVAIADIVFNIGLGGLLHWPHFLSDMAAKDYAAAVAEIKSDEIWVSQVHPTRAGRIEGMILTGTWPADIQV